MDLHWLSFILLLALFAMFFSSLFFVFVTHPEQDELAFTLLKAASAAGWIALPVDLYRTTDARFDLFCVWLLGCMALYLWTARTARGRKLTLAFSLDKPERLLERGPYSIVRHPFYVSYLATYLGTAAVTQKIPSIVAAVTLMAVYIWAARAEERKFLRSPLGEEYARYRKRVGMFFPKIIFPSGGKSRREDPNCIGYNRG